ncbi:pancreatic triacylglycerol lipase-like [Bombina bombina]|uniref:pancreatic triacylglycerol lipase-like n=1 Tax=Bombina bombina TaxID=8345 RepID=UPI00235A4906|nr:pancreatic triacylglycerol lipase-like [Bombina bombina]
MLQAVWIVILLIGTVNGNEVCFERIGCFTNNVPWSGTLERPIPALPWSPILINTHFLLYTRDNPDNFQDINAVNSSTITASNFKPSKKSRFIIHGFIDKGEQNWLKNMCRAMLQVEDVNCLSVDWSGGSRTRYTQAANNIRVVGAEVAFFINALEKQFGYPPTNVHLIGHSLGAHIAGEAGKRKPGIARISGMDPAQPYFEGTPAEVRLDPSDADFVDVIHTDVSPTVPFLGLGIRQTVGHLDFYPNGGEKMPGCKRMTYVQTVDIDAIWEGAQDIAVCNHLRSYKYYTDSILHPDAYIAFASPSYSAFQSGTGFPCPSSGCPRMGHYADTFSGNKTCSQTFYLNTGDAASYARWRYKLSVEIAGSANALGNLQVALHGNNRNTKRYDIFNGHIRTGRRYTGFIDVATDVGTLTKVTFVWTSRIVNFLTTQLGAKSVTVQYGKDGTTYVFLAHFILKILA